MNSSAAVPDVTPKTVFPMTKLFFNYTKPITRPIMSIIDKALEANRNYAKKYDPKLGKPPTPKAAVVTCMCTTGDVRGL